MRGKPLTIAPTVVGARTSLAAPLVDDARARMRVRARYGLPPRRPASSLARLARATSDLAHDAPPSAAIGTARMKSEPTEARVDSSAAPAGNADPRHRLRCVPTPRASLPWRCTARSASGSGPESPRS